MAITTNPEINSIKQQQIALFHLSRMHNTVARAKAKGNAWVISIILGAICGVVVLFVVTGIAGLILLGLPVSEKSESPIPVLMGFLAMIVAWIFSTRFFRRRARRKSIISTSEAQAALEATVDDLKKRLPQWTEEMGGTAALLDSTRVASALKTYRHAPAAAPVTAPSTLPPILRSHSTSTLRTKPESQERVSPKMMSELAKGHFITSQMAHF